MKKPKIDQLFAPTQKTIHIIPTCADGGVHVQDAKVL